MALEYTKRDREKKAGQVRPDHCDACWDPNTARRSLHYDHDHKTGKFRGWLCNGCNTALGNVRDDVKRLEYLITYLKNAQI